MSADNYYRVSYYKGMFTVTMGFESDYAEGYQAEPSDSDPQFESLLAAQEYAFSQYSEYGVSVDEDCWDV